MWLVFRAIKKSLFFLGILLDSYFSATPKQNNYIKNNDMKISETVKSEGWSYGLLVKESNLAECMKKQLEDTLTYSIFERISREIESEEVQYIKLCLDLTRGNPRASLARPVEQNPLRT